MGNNNILFDRVGGAKLILIECYFVICIDIQCEVLFSY